MKTLIFNGSPRKRGGTAMLVEELKKQLHGEVIVINSYNTDISPCVDCRFCWTNNKCSINDEMQNIYSQIDEADSIIIASPVYFAELTGPLLSLMSRLQLFWTKKFRKTEVLSTKKRCGALILVDGGAGHTDTAMSMGKRLLRIMGSEFVGSVYLSGTDTAATSDIIIPVEILSEINVLSAKLNQTAI